MRVSQVSILFVAIALGLSACADANQSASSSGDGLSTATQCDYPSDQTEPARPVDPPPGTNVPNQGTVNATLQLTAGDINLTLDREKAPCTVNSFLSLAEQEYYDNTQCHRLVDEGIFILQCGDPTGTGLGGPGYTFADETTNDLTYTSGVVAMANRGPDTNGSQFFLVFDDSELPPHYTVFATMDDAGLEIIRGIARAGAGDAGPAKPNAEARIKSVTLG
ncbi:peptidylprolyl isomerase [uncultured Tessaracoccus sp.]|uniref:peptidylprolyl isomerase n=1 Tax=uncultured Tessaracoccus sp. TaxID=905023 RepID=UPI0026295D84|nr:peptidylprolyl isomerase [uncultured Tessaracoccus sp.]